MNLSTECLAASQVDSLLQGNLTPEEYEAAQEHLELCETCRARIESTIGPKQWWSDVQNVLLDSRTDSSSPRGVDPGAVAEGLRKAARLRASPADGSPRLMDAGAARSHFGIARLFEPVSQRRGALRRGSRRAAEPRVSQALGDLHAEGRAAGRR